VRLGRGPECTVPDNIKVINCLFRAHITGKGFYGNVDDTSCENETQILRTLAHDTDKGWVTAFSAHIREQLKSNEKFRTIYTAHVLDSQSRKLDDILGALPRLDALQGAIAEISETTKRMEITLNQVIARGHYTNAVGHNYPKYLMQRLFELGVAEDLWEQEITSALERFVLGKAQLAQQTNMPAHMEAQRKLALEMFEQARLDEGEAVLITLQASADDMFESAARDRAKILVDRIPFAEARLGFTQAVKLYEQAANTVLAIDPEQAVDWLEAGGSLGYNRYKLSGEPDLADTAVRLYLAALALLSAPNGKARTGQESKWAGLHNNLGAVYKVLGERGDDGTLAKAVTAFKTPSRNAPTKKLPWTGP